MSEDRDNHLYTVGILILAIALMMFIENKSSCSFPAVQTMLGLLSGLTVYHANFLRKRRKARFSSNSNEEEHQGKNDDGRFLHFYSFRYPAIVWGAESAKVLQISSQNSGRSKAAFSSSQSKIIPTNKHL